MRTLQAALSPAPPADCPLTLAYRPAPPAHRLLIFPKFFAVVSCFVLACSIGWGSNISLSLSLRYSIRVWGECRIPLLASSTWCGQHGVDQTLSGPSLLVPEPLVKLVAINLSPRPLVEIRIFVHIPVFCKIVGKRCIRRNF